MINVTVSGVKEMVAYIKTIPRGAKVVGMRAAGEYFIGDESHGLKWYPRERPNQKYIRTYNLRNSWYLVETNSDWSRTKIGNTAPYSPWVVGDGTQAWMHVGRWRETTKNMMDNLKGAIRAAQSAVNTLLARRK